MHIIGFDIGGTKCAVLLCRLEGEHVIWYDRMETQTTPDWKAVLDALCSHADEMLKVYGVCRSDCCIGISCGGPLSRDRTVISSPPNLPGWDSVPVTAYLSEKLMMPARMLNDADACALAEWKYGAGKGSLHMIFLTFGTGLGAGLILNGRLYTGACGMAGEVGHVRLTEDGPVGYGKKGSLEGFCSGGGIRQMAIKKAEQMEREGEKASFQTGNKESVKAKDVVEAARAGHEDAAELLRESGAYFGKGLSILIDILNPEVIVAGSIYARSHEFLETAMWEEIRREALASSAAACRIVPALLGERIGDYGAVMAAVYE
ncbi:ROK family protein [[Clostridium] saccharolyticum WM1]|uniref:ROK family protein n=2 Tax=Lacrimispora TaxID=2719231 RepID=D9R043_LACSW|nr:ROK family protein [Lacrimispora saccharolytica]ADL04494.1 ROK family protein [[Clostridium] saccharolyticum WM1]